MVIGEFVRVVYKGRPVFHGKRHPLNGEVLEGGWVLDDLSSWEIQWDSRKYNLVPGQDCFVPFEAAVNMFGDPRSGERIVSNRDERGQVGFIPDRATEVRRLRTKYDNLFGNEAIVENYPLVEVYELDGTRITTVLDDPQGESTTPVVKTVREDNELLEIVKRQQATINQLMERVGILPDGSLVQQDTPAPPSPAAIPEPSDDIPELPEDEAVFDPSSEEMTGERGGRPQGEPGIDFASLSDSAVSYGPEA